MTLWQALGPHCAIWLPSPSLSEPLLDVPPGKDLPARLPTLLPLALGRRHADAGRRVAPACVEGVRPL